MLWEGLHGLRAGHVEGGVGGGGAEGRATGLGECCGGWILREACGCELEVVGEGLGGGDCVAHLVRSTAYGYTHGGTEWMEWQLRR